MNRQIYPSTPEITEAIIETAQRNAPSHFRDLAEAMLSDGTVTEDSTIADVKSVLATHNAVQQH